MLFFLITIFSSSLFLKLTKSFDQHYKSKGAKRKANILILWGDDIGQCNLSSYSQGLIGYQTLNVDRVAKEGVKVMHYYAE